MKKNYTYIKCTECEYKFSVKDIDKKETVDCPWCGHMNKTKNKYLIALPAFPKSKGFNHRTVLVSAIDENDAISIARHLKPNDNIGDIKMVDY